MAKAILIRLPEAVEQTLRSIAFATGTTINSHVISAVTEHVMVI